MEEMGSLAETAGYDVVNSLEQVRKPDPGYQIGKGKAEELAGLVKELHAEKVIFDNPVKPVQAYNLATLMGVEVIDRFQLILEIFARRASSSEARLQIELARMRYELPRAREKVKLARMGEQPGFLGLGRYEVDPYYESVRRRISHIRDGLKRLERKRRLHRARRHELGFSLISLAGYTNAGKSTLFNALAEEEVPVDPGLFTTLSTKTRAVNLSKRRVLLTDTVGFIDRLPLTLIEAFHSTLEETIFADLILLIVDVSEPQEEIDRKLTCCLETIQRIGAGGIPTVTALNKVDLLPESESKRRVEALREKAPNPVPVSALQKINLPTLKQEVTNHLEKNVRAHLSLPATEEAQSFLSWLFHRADVRNVKYTGDMVDLVFEAVPRFANKVRGRAERLGGTFKS